MGCPLVNSSPYSVVPWHATTYCPLSLWHSNAPYEGLIKIQCEQVLSPCHPEYPKHVPHIFASHVLSPAQTLLLMCTASKYEHMSYHLDKSLSPDHWACQLKFTNVCCAICICSYASPIHLVVFPNSNVCRVVWRFKCLSVVGV